MTDDYSNYPKSLAEHIAKEEDSSLKWAPRDALIHLLRLIDSGQTEIESLVIAYDTPTSYHDVIAGATQDKAIALFARGLQMRFNR